MEGKKIHFPPFQIFINLILQEGGTKKLCISIGRFHHNFCFSFRLKIIEAQEVIMLQFEKYKMDHNDKLYIKSGSTRIISQRKTVLTFPNLE